MSGRSDDKFLHRRHTLSEVDMAVLYGPDRKSDRDIGPWYRRLLRDSGAAMVLDAMGVHVDDWAPQGAPIGFEPDDMPGQTVDIVALMCGMFRQQRADDEAFEHATDRWRRVPDRVRGYVPSDAGSLRWSLLRGEMLRYGWTTSYGEEFAQGNLQSAMAACAAYLATPYFIPADIAVDVAASRPPSKSMRPDLRLPGRYTMVFHDGIPMALLASGDEELNEWAVGLRYFTDDTLIVGAILLADDDGVPDLNLAHLILARIGPDGVYGWITANAVFGDHPAGRLLYNYAGLLSWEDWSAPPQLPEQESGKAGSARQRRRLARTPEAQAGAWHGVRVLNYTEPPSERPRKRSEPTGEKRREHRYRSDRRGYFKPNVRRGITGPAGDFVGPVYGPDAIEGETFYRKRTWVRGTVTRPDLPPRPDSTVYRIPRNTQRADSSRA